MARIEDRLEALERLVVEQAEEIKSLKEIIRHAKDSSPIQRFSRKRVEREAHFKGFGLKK